MFGNVVNAKTGMVLLAYHESRDPTWIAIWLAYGEKMTHPWAFKEIPPWFSVVFKASTPSLCVDALPVHS